MSIGDQPPKSVLYDIIGSPLFTGNTHQLLAAQWSKKDTISTEFSFLNEETILLKR